MRKKCYYIRHQAGGVLTDTVYLVPPTAEQLAKAKERMDELHGKEHPELGEHWIIVVPGAIEIPEGLGNLSNLEDAADTNYAMPSGDGEEGSGGLPRFQIQATGTVTPAPEK